MIISHERIQLPLTSPLCHRFNSVAPANSILTVECTCASSKLPQNMAACQYTRSPRRSVGAAETTRMHSSHRHPNPPARGYFSHLISRIQRSAIATSAATRTLPPVSILCNYSLQCIVSLQLHAARCKQLLRRQQNGAAAATCHSSRVT